MKSCAASISPIELVAIEKWTQHQVVWGADTTLGHVRAKSLLMSCAIGTGPERLF